MCSVGVLVTDVRAWVWPTQSGGFDGFRHAFLHGHFGLIGKFGLEHEVVPLFGRQHFLENVQWMFHKSLAKWKCTVEVVH